MNKRVIFAYVTVIGILLAALGIYKYIEMDSAIKLRKESIKEIDAYLNTYKPDPFINAVPTKRLSQNNSKNNDALFTYQATESLTFYSHSESWDEQNLNLLYQELLQNKHGKEIETLHEVIVLSEEDQVALALHQTDETEKYLNISFGALPDDLRIQFKQDVTVITLYGGDQRNTVESMAASLSHEYGHLYTFYYMFDDALFSLSDTKYADLRDSTGNNLNDSSIPIGNYINEHHNFLFEVAADDYVQLMGSPATRQVVDFLDVRQSLAGMKYPNDIEFSMAQNAQPQENLTLPLASEVPGLADYFYSFIDEDTPTPQQERQEMNITITSGSQGYDLMGGYRTFTHYDLQWNTPYPDGTIYTVVCHDTGNYQITPIKTVHPGQSGATIGTVTGVNGSYVNSSADKIDQGTKIFYVIAQLPDGTYYKSEPLQHTFS